MHTYAYMSMVVCVHSHAHVEGRGQRSTSVTFLSCVLLCVGGGEEVGGAFGANEREYSQVNLGAYGG